MRRATLEKLKRECETFRAAIVRSDSRELSIGFRYFPRGACGNTSYVLGHFLEEIGFGIFNYVIGYMGQQSHAWLEKEEIAVDITADQFDFVKSKVLVQPTNWHHTVFSRLEVCGPYWMHLDGELNEDGRKYLKQDRLWESYQKIISNITQ